MYCALISDEQLEQPHHLMLHLSYIELKSFKGLELMIQSFGGKYSALKVSVGHGQGRVGQLRENIPTASNPCNIIEMGFDLTLDPRTGQCAYSIQLDQNVISG